jgi:hypothetical protein
MPKISKKKNKFADVPEEFRDAVAGMNEAQIRDRIAKVALDQAALLEAKADDQDLAEKREQAKEAGAGYREGTKLNKLKIEFCRQVLGDKSKPTGEFSAP